MEEQKITPDVQSRDDVRSLQPRKPTFIKRTMTVLLVLVLLAVAALGGYVWRDHEARSELATKTTEISTLQAQVVSLQAKVETTQTADGAVCAVTRPDDNTVVNIRAAVSSGNTAALEGYMAPSVNVIYAASDGLGQRTAANAVSDVTSFLANPTSVSWNFDVPAATLKTYQQSAYKQYFPVTALVAQASDERLLAFSFDCDGKISTVLLVANESSLTS